MDKLNFEQSESLTPPPIPNTDVPTLDVVCEYLNMYMHDSVTKKDWEYGKMFGKDAVFDPKKIIEDVVNIVLDDIKSSDAYSDVMSVSNRKKVAQSIYTLISTFQAPAINLEDSKKITIKLLGYFLSLHVLQESV